MEKDKKGNTYTDVGNIRITLVKEETRDEDSNWAGCDTIRFNAYKGIDSNSLFPGAEIPIENENTILEIIKALCSLYIEKK